MIVKKPISLLYDKKFNISTIIISQSNTMYNNCYTKITFYKCGNINTITHYRCGNIYSHIKYKNNRATMVYHIFYNIGHLATDIWVNNTLYSEPRFKSLEDILDNLNNIHSI